MRGKWKNSERGERISSSLVYARMRGEEERGRQFPPLLVHVRTCKKREEKEVEEEKKRRKKGFPPPLRTHAWGEEAEEALPYVRIRARGEEEEETG